MVEQRAWSWIWGAAVALGLFSLDARASVVEALDLATLVADADVIVVAEAVAEQAHYDELGRIVTDFEMRVERTEKGPYREGETVVVRRLGGVVDGIGMRIEGEPSFTLGEQTLLFGESRVMDQKSGVAVLRPVGMSQGAMRIFEADGKRMVRSGAAGLALLGRDAQGKLVKARAALDGPKALDELLGEVRTLVASQKQR